MPIFSDLGNKKFNTIAYASFHHFNPARLTAIIEMGDGSRAGWRDSDFSVRKLNYQILKLYFRISVGEFGSPASLGSRIWRAGRNHLEKSENPENQEGYRLI